MSKKSAKLEVKSFNKGLITEASLLSFPPDATTDERNFELSPKGGRNKRQPMDLEYGSMNRPFSFGDAFAKPEFIYTFEWYNAGGISGKNIVVIQGNTTLDFYLASGSAISNNWLGSVDLSAMGSTGKKHSLTCVDGKLIVAAGVPTIAVITYTGSGFTTAYDTIKTRDVWGVEYWPTDLDPTLRPVALADDKQKYNLYNQGWGIPRKEGTTLILTDAISLFNAAVSKFPSNFDSPWTGVQFIPPSAGAIAKEGMYANLYAENIGTSGMVARGSYIIDVLDRSASRATAIASNKAKNPVVTMATFAAPLDKTAGGASLVTEFAGRVFYGGFSGELVGGDRRSPVLSNHIFFSNLVKGYRDVVNCFQEGDPTSRDGNDLVDTDGGFIRIAGADQIVRLVSVSTALLVFANNGVWAVSGGNDYGFSATNYRVQKVTSFGCAGSRSVVEDSNSAYMWSFDGIYYISRNQAGDFASENITKQTIHTWYNNIPPASKADVVGFYDLKGRKIRWVYSDTGLYSTGSTQKELIFDQVFKAFTVNEIDASKCAVFGMVKDKLLQVKYLCAYKVVSNYYCSFSQYASNNAFKDWYAIDGTGFEYPAYLNSGPITMDDSAVAKQTPYLTMHFERTERPVINAPPTNLSGCLVQSQWNWSTSSLGNKWGAPFQAYRLSRPFIQAGSLLNTDIGVVTSKSKLRGRGRAVSLLITAEPGKDCRVIGWSISLTENSDT
jgi:hypothetical protein